MPANFSKVTDMRFLSCDSQDFEDDSNISEDVQRFPTLISEDFVQSHLTQDISLLFREEKKIQQTISQHLSPFKITNKNYLRHVYSYPTYM